MMPVYVSSSGLKFYKAARNFAHGRELLGQLEPGQWALPIWNIAHGNWSVVTRSFLGDE